MIEREEASQRLYFEQAKATDNKDIDFAMGQIQMQAKKIVSQGDDENAQNLQQML